MLDLLWAAAALLLILWAAGLFTQSTLGGFIYALLALGVVAVLVRIMFGHRAV